MGKKLKNGSKKEEDSDQDEYKQSSEEHLDSPNHQQKKSKKKGKYIPFKSLNCNFEIIKIIQGINTGKGVECDILVKNTKSHRDYKVKVYSSKLKYIAPLLLCEYYEKHIVNKF